MAKKSLSLDPNDPVLGNDDLRKEILDRFKYAQENTKDWVDLAKEDYDFALGDQWTTQEKQQLKNESRPAFTFNRIKPLIQLITGYQRENSSRIKVNPEGGEDRIFSEVMDRIIKFVDKISHLNYKMGFWFDDGVAVGKGWLEAALTYESDPVRGEIRFLQRSPYQILVDPEFNEYDLNEWPRAQYIFKIVRLTKDALKELYPKYEKLIEGFVKDADDDDAMAENGSGLIQVEGSDDDYGNRPNVTTVVKKKGKAREESGLERDSKFTVKEYWRPKLVTKYFVIDKESGEPRKFDHKELAERFSESQAFGKVIDRKVVEMWVAAQVGGFVLQDEKSSFEPFYSGFPFFRFLAYWTPSAETEELRVQGIVRQLKDAQREKNKAKSQTLHILNTQANSGWIGDTDALTPENWKKLEEMGSKPGITIQKNRGSELREILPKGPNMGQIAREEKADEEFKQISAINPDLLGFQEGTSSGRAISLRIRQAVLSLVGIFHNYRYSKEIIGKFILQMIPMVFDEKKMSKVLGPDYMKKATDPQKYPEGITEGILAGFLTLVKDNKYDVFVSEADQNKTIRYEIFTELTDLIKAGVAIPVDLLIDYMDLPNSQEVKEKVKQEQSRKLQYAQSVGGKKPG